jgi:hypothetical protein
MDVAPVFNPSLDAQIAIEARQILPFTMPPAIGTAVIAGIMEVPREGTVII